MIGISCIDDLNLTLSAFLEKRANLNSETRIVGLIYCRPEFRITKEEIAPSLNYYNFRSGNLINFYFAGYEMSTGPDKRWLFIPESFDQCRAELEACSSWRYSGGTDMILLNARFDSKSKRGQIDFSALEALTLERLKQQGILLTAGMFFEQVFQYCEDCYRPSQSVRNTSTDLARNAKNFIQTLVPQHSPALALQAATNLLQTTVTEAVHRLTAINVSTKTTVGEAKAVAEQIQEVMSPYQKMYKDERMVAVKAEALRRGVPELVVDLIVAECHVSKFPTIGTLMKRLDSIEGFKKLAKSHKGVSRAAIHRWQKIVRDIMARRERIEKSSQDSTGQPMEASSQEETSDTKDPFFSDLDTLFTEELESNNRSAGKRYRADS